jgi:hypothetical protein
MTSKSKTEAFLRSIKLPVHAASYTVIPHAHVIDKVKEELANNNFVITEELYKASTCGNVALGFMKIETDTDSDMSMTFNWINSYNKQLKFGCAIGGFIHDNKVPFVSSKKQATWSRKHTGTAFTETNAIIEDMVNKANQHFWEIQEMKEKFKKISVSSIDYAKLMGLLYFDKNLLSPEQASIISREYKKPSFNYTDTGSLWEVYKMIMYGIAEQHPSKWYNQQIQMNDYISVMYAVSLSSIAGSDFDLDFVNNEDFSNTETVDLVVEAEKIIPEVVEEVIELPVYINAEPVEEFTFDSIDEPVNLISDAEIEVIHEENNVPELKETQDCEYVVYDDHNADTIIHEAEETSFILEAEEDNFFEMLISNEAAAVIETVPVAETIEEAPNLFTDIIEEEIPETVETVSLSQNWPLDVLKNLLPGELIVKTIPLNDQTIYVKENGDFFIN